MVAIMCPRLRGTGCISPEWQKAATPPLSLSLSCWGGTTTSMIVLRCLVLSMMLLMMYQLHLHQPWRLDSLIHSITVSHSRTAQHHA